MERILIIGANGQIGSELVTALAEKHGAQNVIASDISETNVYGAERYTRLDVMDRDAVARLIADEGVTQVYQLAALLSATGEKAPLKVFWPSSIAAFGPNTPAENTPQYTVMDPTSIYGISKLAGERLCEYYHAKYGVDVRSIRYPGIISFKSPPGGGTTDYAIAIFHAALKNETYECFLGPETTLPMIYMPDAIRATIELMEAPAGKVVIRSSYNVAGVSFNPRELAAAIQRKLPDFRIAYKPDSRQQIADSWPKSLDDARATADWGWKAKIGVEEMVADMLENVDVGQAA
jgi:nucleoside-diphosphate-sugar epimerase